MSELTKADFFGAKPAPPLRVDLDVKGWEGRHVHIRALPGEERDAFELSLAGEGKAKENVSARLVALCACNADGQRIFTDDDARQLGRKDGRVLAVLFGAACDHNLLLGRGRKVAEKNSETAPGSGSPSGSPATSE